MAQITVSSIREKQLVEQRDQPLLFGSNATCNSSIHVRSCSGIALVAPSTVLVMEVR